VSIGWQAVLLLLVGGSSCTMAGINGTAL